MVPNKLKCVDQDSGTCFVSENHDIYNFRPFCHSCEGRNLQVINPGLYFAQ